MKTVVVVGTGVAGTTTASTLRELGYGGRLLLVGREPHPPYRRTALSKDVLGGAKTVDQVLLHPDAWYGDHAIDLLAGTTVTALRPGAIELDGRVLPADATILATGGAARPLPGALTLRTAADVDVLRERLTPGHHAVVIGAGFLGAEVASAALSLGAAVTVLEAAPSPFARVLPAAVGDAVARRHRAHGIDLRVGTGLARVEGRRVVDTSGAVHDADLVLAAIGQQPDVALAATAGALTGDGIAVDRCGRTSLPGVWAAGDAAAFPDRSGTPRRLEHWHAAMTQGAVVARALLGDDTGWADVPWAWSRHAGLDLQVCGHPHPDDDVTILGDPDGAFVALLSRGGESSGAVTVDRTPAMRTLRTLFASDPHVDVATAAAAVDDHVQEPALVASAR